MRCRSLQEATISICNGTLQALELAGELQARFLFVSTAFVVPAPNPNGEIPARVPDLHGVTESARALAGTISESRYRRHANSGC